MPIPLDLLDVYLRYLVEWLGAMDILGLSTYSHFEIVDVGVLHIVRVIVVFVEEICWHHDSLQLLNFIIEVYLIDS